MNEEVEIKDKLIIPLEFTNDDIGKLLPVLDFSKISSYGSKFNKPKPLKIKKRLIDKQIITKRNVFHKMIMRRY